MTLIKSNFPWTGDLFPAFNSVWDDFFNKDSFSRRLELGTSVPAVNISEENDQFLIDVAVPGMKKEDLKINLNDNILTISCEKKEEKEEKDKKITRREFSYSSFMRSFQLPENIKAEEISAEYKEGVLKLKVPKQEESKQAPTPKQISIQ
jgi:HSP20 family protein